MRCIRVLIQIIVISLAPIVVDSFSGALNPVRSISTPDITKLRERLQAKFDSLHAAGQFPGATAGFVLADGSSFGLATGFSDKTKKIRMTSADLMLQGSVGKTYVAATALQLVHEGKINLNDKIEKYLGNAPWFPRLPNARDITVRMLMNHTSGLVRYEFKEQFTTALTNNPDKVWKPEELVAYILDTAPPFAAGKDWDYSDTNYIVQGKAFDTSLLPQMLDGVPAKLGPNTKYGLGVILRQTPFGASYGHSGFFPGYLAEMMYFPETKMAIAVQVNTSVPRATGQPLTRSIYDFARMILDEQNH